MKAVFYIVVVVAVAVLQGCAVLSELDRDHRDAPWDPRGSAQLFDQIPAWDGAAAKICCSGLLGDRTAWITARCDTDTPVPPRSNRC